MNFIDPGRGQFINPLFTTQLTGGMSQFIRLFSDLAAQQSLGKQASKEQKGNEQQRLQFSPGWRGSYTAGC